ncbi:MAG: glycine cleavage system protein GcvH [Thermoplasmata archaeon]|nr:glycine cleavage system protein GcvH [Thermoplasmata archaeon]
MVNIPDDLLYTETHEWVKVEGKNARIGITDYAQEALTEIVNIDFAVEAGSNVKKGDGIVVLDSVKSSNEVYSPVTGKIVELNEGLKSELENINKSPYGSGWLAVIEVANPDELKVLLTAEAYRKLIQQ